MRGILICLIVLGHNRILYSDVPGFVGFLYHWHVHGFFFLTLATRGLSYDRYRISDMLTRYFVPFAIFLTIAAAIQAVRGGIRIEDYAFAILIGSARLCNAATDMSLFWFLPALAGMVTILIVISRIKSRGLSAWQLLLSLCAIGLAASYFVPREFWKYVPLGLGVVAYILPLSAMFWLLTAPFGPRFWKQAIWAAFLIMLLTMSSMYVVGVHIDISLFKFGNDAGFGTFVAAAAIALSANILIYLGALRFSPRWLRTLGGYSLEIFLLHSFVQTPILLIVNKVLATEPVPLRIAVAVTVSGVAILLSAAAAQLLTRLPRLRAIVLPKDWPSFRDGLTGNALSVPSVAKAP